MRSFWLCETRRRGNSCAVRAIFTLYLLYCAPRIYMKNSKLQILRVGNARRFHYTPLSLPFIHSCGMHNAGAARKSILHILHTLLLLNVCSILSNKISSPTTAHGLRGEEYEFNLQRCRCVVHTQVRWHLHRSCPYAQCTVASTNAILLLPSGAFSSLISRLYYLF